MAHDVFVSHSTADKSVADAACHALEARGIRCWIAPRDIPYGSTWADEVIEAIEESRALLLVFSSNANESRHAYRELSYAAEREIPILPLWIEDVLPSRGFRFFLGSVHWLDALNPPLETHLERLADRISALLVADETSGSRDRETPQSPSSGRGSKDQAKRIDPDDAEFWKNKGVALKNQGRHQAAIEAFDRALRIDPDYADAWYNKGWALYNRGHYQEAIEANDRALRIDPDYADAWNNRGWALYNRARYKEAIEAYDQALRIDPGHAVAWNNKGLALYNQGRHQEALEAYDRALSIDPHHPYARKNKDLARRKGKGL